MQTTSVRIPQLAVGADSPQPGLFQDHTHGFSTSSFLWDHLDTCPSKSGALAFQKYARRLVVARVVVGPTLHFQRCLSKFEALAQRNQAQGSVLARVLVGPTLHFQRCLSKFEALAQRNQAQGSVLARVLAGPTHRWGQVSLAVFFFLCVSAVWRDRQVAGISWKDVQDVLIYFCRKVLSLEPVVWRSHRRRNR